MQSGFHAVAHLERADRGPAVVRGYLYPYIWRVLVKIYFLQGSILGPRHCHQATARPFKRAAYITPRIRRINVANNTH